jgi:hypothetical protein
VVLVAVPIRAQAEAIARTAAKLATALAVLFLALAGCGDDGGGRSGGDSTSATHSEHRRTEQGTTPEEEHSGGHFDVEDVAGEARPTRRDRSVQRDVKRYLRQQELGGAGGWRFTDVKEIQARATQLAIDTRLGPARREAAMSLCLAAQRFFLQSGQGQTPYNVLVGGRGGILAKC